MHFDRMRRREFITLLGGTAAAWPLAARAQGGRMRRIGVFLPSAASDPELMSRNTALSQGLQELGWTHGRNVRIEFRWGEGHAKQYRKIAAELVALAPDVVVAHGTLAVSTLQRTTHSVPIVFVQVADPVGDRHRLALLVRAPHHWLRCIGTNVIDDLDALVRAVGLKAHESAVRREQNSYYGHNNGLMLLGCRLSLRS